MTPWSFDDHKYSMSEMEKAIESYNFFKGKEVYVKASVKITFSRKDAEYIYFDSDQDMRDWVDSFISKYGKKLYFYITFVHFKVKNSNWFKNEMTGRE